MIIEHTPAAPDVNPATGLPIFDGSGFDVGRNPYGTDLNSLQPTYDPSPCPTPEWTTFDPW